MLPPCNFYMGVGEEEVSRNDCLIQTNTAFQPFCSEDKQADSLKKKKKGKQNVEVIFFVKKDVQLNFVVCTP